MPCEVIGQGPRRVIATVVSLSEGGLGLQAPLSVELGDSIRLRILPQRGERAVSVEGIVWNDRPAPRAGRGASLRLLCCFVSSPPPPFLELFSEIEKRKAVPARPTPLARIRSAQPSPEPEADLPRSQAPLPPPKPEPEETLPRFRVRLKQVGGPRTRVITVRARSMADAAERARAELERTIAGSADAWALLGVAPGG